MIIGDCTATACETRFDVVLFCICNNFQISGRSGIADLGSEYGNQPYRSFREQTVPPHRPGDRAQHQRLCQHPQRLAGATVPHDFFECGTARPGLLLWRRSGRRWPVARCSDDSGLVLWRRSGWWRPVARQEHFSDRFADSAFLLLRWRSGRRRPVAGCSRQGAGELFADRLCERSGLLLRWRSGWRRPVAVRASAGGGERSTLVALSDGGRFSSGRGGQ
jgi:hypothetical protein